MTNKELYQLTLFLPTGLLFPLHPQELRLLALAMLRHIAPTGARLELALVRDAEIAELNAVYLGCQGPTNCLAFVDRAGLQHGLCGNLFISTDAVQRECFLYGQGASEHVARLLAHGLAHLAGFEHGPQMDALCAELEALAAQGTVGLAQKTA